MEQIVFIIGNHCISYSSLIITLAAAGAICVFLALYLAKGGELTTGAAVVPLALLLSLGAGRLIHWYCFAESYDSFASAMTVPSQGGYVLVGTFAGCIAAAALTRALKLHQNLPRMLDCMSVAGAAGIYAGRLSAFFSNADRGQLVSLRSLPWAVPMINRVSGETEYRLATFVLQSMTTLILFDGLLIFFLFGNKRRRKDGDTALLFLLFYGGIQILLDSTRYDTLHFRSNGFISIVQICSLGILLVPIVLFSCRFVRRKGFQKWLPILWGAMACAAGIAGYMEYYVQRHGNRALFAYSVMGTCLAILVSLALFLYIAGRISSRR